MAKQKLTGRAVEAAAPRAEQYEINDTEIPGFVLRVSPAGTKTFFVVFRTEAGQRRRLKLGRAEVMTTVQARDLAKAKLSEVAMGIDPAKERHEKRQDITLREWLDTVYAPWVKAHLKSHVPTLSHARTGMGGLLDKKLRSITAFDFERHRAQRGKVPREGAKKAPSPSTLNRQLGVLRAALTRAVAWGYLDKNPLTGIKPAKEDRRATVRFLTPDEEARLFAALHARDLEHREKRDRFNAWRKARHLDTVPSLPQYFVDHLEPMIVLSLNTGLRRGEVFNLVWADVDLPARRLTVQGAGAKSGSTRHVDLNRIAVDALTKWKEQGSGNGRVFPSSNGGRLDNVSTAWKALLKAAVIKGFRWHDMRHDFASKLVQRGVDLAVVRELLGHSDIALTLRYSHLRPQDRRRAVDALVDNVIAFPERDATTSEG